ncbi:MAG: MBL fold metallo-hydrolase [Deltaproteobacteria bacterium]|jgi:glyoxylase-like metal-dependent hydrolase (beta-lactamase superfamily II)|nr:MBL fold metallo-hydrolase [Deltaproteobacteria bacterium]
MRHFILSTITVFIAVFILGLCPTLAENHANGKGYLAPGVFTMNYGNLIVYSFEDRKGRLDFSIIRGVSKAEIQTIVGSNPELSDSSLTSYVSVFVIKSPDGLYLVDTGLGADDNLTKYLKVAGYTPKDVTDVFLTHFHQDHINGLLKDGQPLFPNATIWASQVENDYWLSGGSQGGQNAEEKISPYRRKGRYVTFKPGQELKPGVQEAPLYGHTPGHVGFLFQAGNGLEFLAWGDIVHAYLLQFSRPDVTMTYDVDETLAAATRRSIFAKAAAAGYLVAGTHLPYPSLGHVKGSPEKGYIWTSLK